MKYFSLICVASLALLLTAGCANSGKTAKQLNHPISELDLTIYHLEGRRSERIVWLCEELGIPYELKYKLGDLRGSMQTIRDLNPMMPVAPTVEIEGKVMVESGAIIEFILAKYMNDKLKPALDSPDYPYYLQWMHFAEGSFSSRVITEFAVNRVRRANDIAKPEVVPGRARLVDTPKVLTFLDTYLSQHPYFGGESFSAADIMMLFPTNLTQAWYVADLSPYKNLLAWRDKVQNRPAYLKMLEVARPNGIPALN